MHAKMGDRIIVKGHHIGEADRVGEIVATGRDGAPPFTVRWVGSAHEALFFPGSDSVIETTTANGEVAT